MEEVLIKPKKNATAKQLAEAVAQGMIDKKAQNIVIMDLCKVNQAMADYFVIASANSGTQVDAIRDSIEDAVYKITGEVAQLEEGRENKEWILMDFSNVVVHIFRTDKREFYALEELWGDAKITRIASE